MAVGDCLLELGIELGEPLAKAGLPASAPPHSPKVVWRGQYKSDRE
jgi:hypothetical protein